MLTVSHDEDQKSVSARISVVMPAYNEEETVVNAIRNISDIVRQAGYRCEIVVVDDGSTDQTRSTLMRVPINGDVKVVGYEKNMGKGYAIKYASQYVTGEYVIFIDSDLEIDPSNLKLYVRSLKDADLVIASKRHPNSSVAQPITRKILSIGFHILVRLLTGVRQSDTQAGLKAFRAGCIRRILPLLSVKKYAFDVEILTVASLLGMRVAELPVRIELKAGFSLRHMARMMIDLLGIAYRLRVIRWYERSLNNPYAQYNPLIRW